MGCKSVSYRNLLFQLRTYVTGLSVNFVLNLVSEVVYLIVILDNLVHHL